MRIIDLLSATISSISGDNFTISLSGRQTKSLGLFRHYCGGSYFYFNLRGDFIKYVKRKNKLL